MDLNQIATSDLFAVCATLDCAHEWEALEAAKRALVRWGITEEEALVELRERERT